MRDVQVSSLVELKLAELELFLIEGFKLPQDAAVDRVARIRKFLHSLSNPADYALCRFKQWREHGWRCTSLDGWVFAYEVFSKGVLVRDMAHSATLWDVD